MAVLIRELGTGSIGALLHGGEHASPTEWVWGPSVALGVMLLTAAYLYAVGPLRRRLGWAKPIEPWRLALFLSGNLLLVLSLISPLEVLSDEYLFSAHMVQHILLTMFVAPLWLLGTPAWALEPLLKRRTFMKVARFLTRPAVAFVLFNGNFWLWHWPALYDLALANENVHIVQHLTFLATAVVNWWPVLSPTPEIPRAPYPIQLLYLAVNCQPNVFLGAAFTFAPQAFYQGYADAPRLFDLSLVADQRLGGLMIWIPGNVVYLVVLSIVFLRWFGRQQTVQHDWSS